MKIAILIRVYNRIEDLKHNLQIIKDTWKQNEYYIIVISNGAEKGYFVDDSSKDKIDKLVVLDKNSGHMSGSNQLLNEGVKHIPTDCKYTLILEADTWLYGDSIITKYTNILANSDSVWASANWYDKYHALAVDYAIMDSEYIKKNTQLFDFGDFPECYIANCLRDTNSNFTLITENMPVHVPSYVAKYPYVNNKHRRFYVFPKAKMATHHIEELKDGFATKKRYFNIVSGYNYFPESKVKWIGFERLKMRFLINLSNCFLRRSWYSKKQYKNLD